MLCFLFARFVTCLYFLKLFVVCFTVSLSWFYYFPFMIRSNSGNLLFSKYSQLFFMLPVYNTSWIIIIIWQYWPSLEWWLPLITDLSSMFYCQRNLRAMANMDLTAKQEKDDQIQKMKQEVAEMVKSRTLRMKSKVCPIIK